MKVVTRVMRRVVLWVTRANEEPVRWYWKCRKAIIDKNARIGQNVVIKNADVSILNPNSQGATPKCGTFFLGENGKME